MSLNSHWLGSEDFIQKRYINAEINFFIIIITVRNKLEADRLIIKGLHFGEYNHTVNRYWDIRPEEICLKCGDYGHTKYKGCTKPARCYICAGAHEANEHKCPVTTCQAIMRKLCVHLSIKCIHCAESHLITFSYCPKRRTAIKAAKKAKAAEKREKWLNESRKRI